VVKRFKLTPVFYLVFIVYNENLTKKKGVHEWMMLAVANNFKGAIPFTLTARKCFMFNPKL
jgi:hypothetical protein